MQVKGQPFQRERLRSRLDSIKGDLKVNIDEVLDRVIPGLYDGVEPELILELSADTAAAMATKHPDYSIFGGRIACQRLYKTTPSSFRECVHELRDLLDETFKKNVEKHNYDVLIDHKRDNELSYFGFQTLKRSYLYKCNGKTVERPQYLFMRVAVALHGDDFDAVRETYDLMSERFFIHATPTLFNAGSPRPQLSSCFLLGLKEDSIEGIFDTLKDCAIISKYSGGIGLHVSNLRASGSQIGKNDGIASGLVPMLRVFNNMARYVDQGGNKRPGAVSITLEPWHADLLPFLDLRKPHGKEEYRARDLFYALWIPDLFMKTVKENGTWYLFSPDTAPGLSDVVGEEFEKLYFKYVEEERYIASHPAQEIWNAILDAQTETGNPSLLYKDAANLKSNQKNLGTIKSSNLCTEIIEYSSGDEIAVCNLASLALPMYISDGEFDFDKLHRVTKVVTSNLDKIMDLNYYPLPECQKSNMAHRPIGIGVQGLADTYFALGLAFDSPEAAKLNSRIFETIYHAALERSIELAEEKGSYSSYEGSPASMGQLQFDFWEGEWSSHFDWAQLKKKLAESGLRNSLLTAVMPTASTSQILGFTECIEPLTSNIYSRRVLSGEFQIVNRYLVYELEKLGLWTENTRNEIMANNGSVQNIEGIPENIKSVFKTVWEISQKVLIDQSADRGRFIDHSQSLNLFLPSPLRRKLTSMQFYAWKKGLKTGIYYLRTLAASSPTPFTLDYNLVKRIRDSQSATPEPKYKKQNCFGIDSCDVCSA